MSSTATERKIQRHFSYTDKGVNALEAGLRLFFGRYQLDYWLGFDEQGMHITPDRQLAAQEGWQAFDLEGLPQLAPVKRELAKEIQAWLDGLTGERRFAIHRSTPLDSFSGRADDGFRMSNDTCICGEDILTIQPAWV